VQAHFDRGVLEVTIPKPEQKKPRTVTITPGARSDTNTIEGTESVDAAANSSGLAGASA
jgi:hypothetical protein